jgi:large subunit ribosomal protein L9
VTTADIAAALAERGVEVERRRIMLEHPIKELGAFDITLHIHRGIDVTIPVTVVRPGEDPDALAPEFVAEGTLETDAHGAVEVQAADETTSRTEAVSE